MNATAATEAPKIKSAKEMALENAKILWREILTRKDKIELAKGPGKKAKEKIKNVVLEHDMLYQNDEEQGLLEKALLTIVKKKRSQIREKQRHKKQAEVRLKIASITNISKEDTLADEDIAELEPIVDQEIALATKALNRISKKNQIELLKAGLKLDEKNKNNLLNHLKKSGVELGDISFEDFYEQLYDQLLFENEGKDFSIEQKDHELQNNWVEINEQWMEHIKKIEKPSDKYLENAKLILYQLNTGTRFSKEKRKQIAMQSIYYLVDELLEMKEVNIPNFDDETKKVARSIFNRIRKDKKLAIAVVTEYFRQNPEIIRNIKKKSTINIKELDPKTHEPIQKQSSEIGKPENTEKPNIDWRNADPKTHGPKKKKPSIVAADINIPPRERAQPSIEYPNMQKINAPLNKASESMEEAISNKGEFMNYSTKAYEALKDFRELESDTPEDERKHEIKELIKLSEAALLGLNVILPQLKENINTLRENKSKHSQDKYRELLSHYQALNKVSPNSKTSLEKRLQLLHKEAEKTFMGLRIDGEYYHTGDKLNYYSEKRGRSVKVKIMGVTKEKIMMQTIHPKGKQSAYFTVSREDAERRLSAIPEESNNKKRHLESVVKFKQYKRSA